MSARHQCPHCDRSFADENARWQHAKAKHGRKQAKALRPPEPEREESYGELFARAMWDDDPSLDVIREMLP
jgi:hypothetical protein